MANVGQRHWTPRRHRYSIKQLLALSRGTSFDLSKFTFDAARAGVIPSLGDCAVSSRRSSATRRQVSSENAFVAMNSTTSSAGTGAAKAEPRPHPPPFVETTQQNTGFARFLRKHSSPTHQRVTAGGRIVPMESRAPPPPFNLMTNRQVSLHEGEQASAKQQDFVPTNAYVRNEMPRPTTAGTTGYKLPNNQIRQHLNEDLLAEGYDAYMNSHVPDDIPNNFWGSAVSLDAMIHHPPLVASGKSSTFCSDYMQGGMSTCPPWQPYCSTPAMAMYPQPATWSSHGTVGASIPVFAAPSHHLAQPILWAQNALSEWSYRYNELDVQLKALDRHRAMTNLTSDIAVQRREIVQHRSDSKNMISLISTWLSLSQHIQPDVNFPPTASSFNVDAQTYTPVSQRYRCTKIGKKVGENQESIPSMIGSEKPSTRSTRRPIPIVPPPRPETYTILPENDLAFPTKHIYSGTVSAGDSKTKSVPPVKDEHRTDLNRSSDDVQSPGLLCTTSSKSLQSVFDRQHSPQAAATTLLRNSCTLSLNEADQVVAVTDNSSLGSEMADEESFAALRKSIEAMTKVKIQAKFGAQVEGQEEQCSKTQFKLQDEEDYLLREGPLALTTASEGINFVQILRTTTPVYQRLPPSTPGRSRQCHSDREDVKENLTMSPAIYRKAAVDTFLAGSNSGEFYDEATTSLHGTPSQLRDNGTVPNLQHLRKYQGASRPHRGILTSPNRYGIQHQGLRHSEDTFSTTIQSQPFYKNSEQLFNTKGFSLTSVQNVNVAAHLPQTLDGTTDNSKNSKSILSLVGKVKSPRVLRRTTATG